jgi:hypothetical protein
MTSIVDDRGQELLYAGMPITDVIKEDMGIGGVLSLLWFRKRFVLFLSINFVLNSINRFFLVYQNMLPNLLK